MISVGILFSAIEQGLVSHPDMRVVGNGSHDQLLRWYQDRSGPSLPRPLDPVGALDGVSGRDAGLVAVAGARLPAVVALGLELLARTRVVASIPHPTGGVQFPGRGSDAAGRVKSRVSPGTSGGCFTRNTSSAGLPTELAHRSMPRDRAGGPIRRQVFLGLRRSGRDALCRAHVPPFGGVSPLLRAPQLRHQPRFQFVLAFLGGICTQRGALWWAANHRQHHAYADRPGDLHSPARDGFYWSHLGWLLSRRYETTRLDRIRDFARFPELRWLDRHHFVPSLVYPGALLLLGGWSA